MREPPAQIPRFLPNPGAAVALAKQFRCERSARVASPVVQVRVKVVLTLMSEVCPLATIL